MQKCLVLTITGMLAPVAIFYAAAGSPASTPSRQPLTIKQSKNEGAAVQPTQGITTLHAENEEAKNEAEAGLMSEQESRRFVHIENAWTTHGYVSDAQLFWIIKLMQSKSSNPAMIPNLQQQIMIRLANERHPFSAHQRDMYLPVFVSYTKSPHLYVRKAALYVLWSLKDMRAAPIFAKAVNDPNYDLTEGQRIRFSKFAQHCKS